MDEAQTKNEPVDGFVRNSFSKALFISVLVGACPCLVLALTSLIYFWLTEPQRGMLFGGGPPSPSDGLFWTITGIVTLFGGLVGGLLSPLVFVVARVKPLGRVCRIALLFCLLLGVPATVIVLETTTGFLLSLPILWSVISVLVCVLVAWMMPTRVRRGYCNKCGYNLKGNVSGFCPECGWMANRKY